MGKGLGEQPAPQSKQGQRNEVDRSADPNGNRAQRRRWAKLYGKASDGRAES